MILNDWHAFILLGVCCLLFIRFGTVRETSPGAGTAGLQGERTGGVQAPGACRCEVEQ